MELIRTGCPPTGSDVHLLQGEMGDRKKLPSSPPRTHYKARARRAALNREIWTGQRNANAGNAVAGIRKTPVLRGRYRMSRLGCPLRYGPRRPIPATS